MNIRYIKYILIGILLIGLIGCTSKINNHPQKDYSEFAKCLTENNMKMYGAAWCSHCSNMKAKFGDAFKHIDYTECDASFGGDPKACEDAGAEYYPAFTFGDEPIKFGEIEFSVMSEKTGCLLP